MRYVMVVLDNFNSKSLMGTCTIRDLTWDRIKYYYKTSKGDHSDSISSIELLRSRQVPCIIDLELIPKDMNNLLLTINPGIIGGMDTDSFKLTLEILDLNNCLIHKNEKIFNQFMEVHA